MNPNSAECIRDSANCFPWGVCRWVDHIWSTFVLMETHPFLNFELKNRKKRHKRRNNLNQVSSNPSFDRYTDGITCTCMDTFRYLNSYGFYLLLLALCWNPVAGDTFHLVCVASHFFLCVRVCTCLVSVVILWVDLSCRWPQNHKVCLQCVVPDGATCRWPRWTLRASHLRLGSWRLHFAAMPIREFTNS